MFRDLGGFPPSRESGEKKVEIISFFLEPGCEKGIQPLFSLLVAQKPPVQLKKG
ncbi:Hypothetical protein Minf_1909 [Methylacidiphilum infernorum V4]|uniref:Uncharacterized protein n=1 Tax=Methylacidiphilum infernorum (isolate V4) TaxID=481448 RepID=B3DY11_METI4|nr:Hypothetical protein Minf_1909 [Methylacidiphilum infernorum V4]